MRSRQTLLSDRTSATLTFAFIFFRGFFRWLCIALGGYHIHGREHIPTSGAVIIATNHTSVVDAPLVAWCTKRPVRCMAKSSLFKMPVIGTWWTALGAFPVSRGSADRNAIRTALGVLANGELLLLFPEGRRGDGATLGKAKKGMAMIALKANVPIIPAYIEGPNKMFPTGFHLPRRARLYIRIGSPIDLAPFQGKDGLDALGPAVMARIEKLRDEHVAVTARKTQAPTI